MAREFESFDKPLVGLKNQYVLIGSTAVDNVMNGVNSTPVRVLYGRRLLAALTHGYGEKVLRYLRMGSDGQNG